MKHNRLEQKYTQKAFKSHNIYVIQTILDQKHRKICNFKWMTKFYKSFSNPPPILEKSEKNQYFEMCQTHICRFKLFLVFSHNIELGNIVRIKERNIYGSVHIRENQPLENRHFKPFFGCFIS